MGLASFLIGLIVGAVSVLYLFFRFLAVERGAARRPFLRTEFVSQETAKSSPRPPKSPSTQLSWFNSLTKTLFLNMIKNEDLQTIIRLKLVKALVTQIYIE